MFKLLPLTWSIFFSCQVHCKLVFVNSPFQSIFHDIKDSADHKFIYLFFSFLVFVYFDALECHLCPQSQRFLSVEVISPD